MVMEAGGRGRSGACDEAPLPRAARHMTLAINSVDAGRIWKRWRGFRAAAAVVCGSEAGSITSCITLLRGMRHVAYLFCYILFCGSK